MSDTVYTAERNPAPAPESCFVWDGTIITNLTPEGEMYLKDHNGVIGIPDKCTSITGGFQGREGVTIYINNSHDVSTPDLFYKPMRSTKLETTRVELVREGSSGIDPLRCNLEIYCDEYWGKNPRIEIRLIVHCYTDYSSSSSNPVLQFPYDGTLEEVSVIEKRVLIEQPSAVSPISYYSEPFIFYIDSQYSSESTSQTSRTASGTLKASNLTVRVNYENLSSARYLTAESVLSVIPLSDLIDESKGKYLSSTVRLGSTDTAFDYSFTGSTVGTITNTYAVLDDHDDRETVTTSTAPTVIQINSPKTTSYVTEFYNTNTESFMFADVRSGGLTLAGGSLLGLPIVISELHSTGPVLDSQGIPYGAGDVPLFADCIGHLKIYENDKVSWYANGPLSEGTFVGLTQEDDGNWYVSSSNPCIIPPEVFPANFSVTYKNSYEGTERDDRDVDSGGKYYFTKLYSTSWTPLRYYEGWREVGQVPENIVPEGHPFKLLGSFTSELYSPEGEHSAYKYRKYYSDEFLKRLLTSTVEFEAVSESDSVKIIPLQDSRYVSFAPISQEDRKSTSDDRYYSLAYGLSLSNLRTTPDLDPPMLVRDLYEHRNFYILESPGYRLDDTGGSFIARITVRRPYEDASDVSIPARWFYRYPGNVGPAIAGLFRYIVDVDGTPEAKTALCVVGLTEDSNSLFGYYKDSEFRTDLIQTVGVIVYQGKQLQFCISDSGLPAAELNEYGVPVTTIYDVSNRWLQFITQEYVDIDNADSIVRTLISNYYKHRVRSDDLAIGREMKVLEDYQPASNKSYCKQNTVWNPTVPFVALAEGQKMSLESSYFLNKSSHHLESLIYKKSPEGKWISPEVSYVVRKKLSDGTLADSLVTNRDEGVYSYSKQRSHGKLARSFKIIPSIGAPSEKITFSDLLNDQNNSYTINRDTVVEYLQDDVEDVTPKSDDNKVVYWSSEDLPGTRYVIADFSDLNYEELGISFAGEDRSNTYRDIQIIVSPTGQLLGESYTDTSRELLPSNGYSSVTRKEDSVMIDQFTIKRTLERVGVDSHGRPLVKENSIFTVMITSSSIEIPEGALMRVAHSSRDIIHELPDLLGVPVSGVNIESNQVFVEKCISNAQGLLVRERTSLILNGSAIVISDSETSKKFKWKAPFTYHDLSENKRFFAVTFLQTATWSVDITSNADTTADEDQNN